MTAKWMGTLMVLAGAGFGAASCSSVTAAGTSAEEVVEQDETNHEGDAEAERKSLETKLIVAERKMAHAQMEREMHEADSMFSVKMAEHEVRLAEAALAQFNEVDMPTRIARSELSLGRSRDMAQEAQEELEQIMIMYKEQDLEDMTAEFVINRGKRNAERSKRSLALQEREHESLTGFELPQEKHRLEMAVHKAHHSLEQSKAKAKAGALMKEISLINAETELQETKRKLDEKVEG